MKGVLFTNNHKTEGYKVGTGFTVGILLFNDSIDLTELVRLPLEERNDYVKNQKMSLSNIRSCSVYFDGIMYYFSGIENILYADNTILLSLKNEFTELLKDKVAFFDYNRSYHGIFKNLFEVNAKVNYSNVAFTSSNGSNRFKAILKY